MLARALAAPGLADALRGPAAEFLERYGEAALPRAGALRAGLAAVLASQPAAAGFLLRRSSLAERLANLDDAWLATRAEELERGGADDARLDLEDFLDALRLLRREDTLLAACLDLGGVAPFAEVSAFLSRLAEIIVRRAFAIAETHGRRDARSPRLAVVAMGKLAGREFTYHSDLDLIFLTPGGAEEVEGASRIAQRLVGYLSTMTGAGVAYPVDARLRPSGHQGMLVTTFEGFERYQLEQAAPWEHLALMRARAIAGAIDDAQALLDRTRAVVRTRHPSPWRSVAELRERVHAERGQDQPTEVPFKAGRGGIMDVEFLACGGMLERGDVPAPRLPSVPAMLAASCGGAGTNALLKHYAFLRKLEARVRWVADRAEESFDPQSASFETVTCLLASAGDPGRWLEQLAEVRRAIEARADQVIGAGTIRVLAA